MKPGNYFYIRLNETLCLALVREDAKQTYVALAVKGFDEDWTAYSYNFAENLDARNLERLCVITRDYGEQMPAKLALNLFPNLIKNWGRYSLFEQLSFLN